MQCITIVGIETALRVEMVEVDTGTEPCIASCLLCDEVSAHRVIHDLHKVSVAAMLQAPLIQYITHREIKSPEVRLRSHCRISGFESLRVECDDSVGEIMD